MKHLVAALVGLCLLAGVASAQTPKLTSASPTGLVTSSTPQLVTVLGQTFRSGMKVYVDGVATPVVLVNGSAFRWTAVLTNTVRLTAKNLKGGLSAPLTITVAANPPPPTPPLQAQCPANVIAISPDGAPVTVSVGTASANGGTPPYTVTYFPSTSTFAVGTTAVNVVVADSGTSPKQATSCGFTVTVTYTAPPPPPPQTGPVPAWGPDAPETSTAPLGYTVRIKAPMNQMRFTVGVPVRIFADVVDPNDWTCPPGHPPYNCPQAQVDFYDNGVRLGSLHPNPDNQDLWEWTQPFALGAHRLTVVYHGVDGTVVQGDAPGRVIVIDPVPIHATTLTLAADLVLTTPLSDVTINGNGHSVTANGTAPLAITNAFLYNLGSSTIAGLDLTTTAGLALDRVVVEASGAVHLVAPSPLITGLEIRANHKQIYVSSNPDAGHILDAIATSGTGVLQGRIGGGIVTLSAPWLSTGRWQVGGLTASQSFVMMGPRATLSLCAPTTVQGSLVHHLLPLGWSQGFNLITCLGQTGILVEHSLIDEASWSLQNLGGEVRYTVFLDRAQHDVWRTATTGTRAHHNLFVHLGGTGTAAGGTAWFYQGETGLTFSHNTFHGAGQYPAPVIQMDNGSGLASFDHNLTAAYVGTGPLLTGNTAGVLQSANVNGWWNGAAQSYQPGLAVGSPGLNDVNADPMFQQAIDTTARLDEGLIWTGQFSVFEALQYFRYQFTPTNLAVNDMGAVGVAGQPVALDDRLGTIASPGTGSTSTPPGGTIPPPTTAGLHPRIWLTASELLMLGRKVSANDPTWVSTKQSADALLTLTVPAYDRTATPNNAISYPYQGGGWYDAIERLGLAYQVTRNQAYCTKALDVVAVMNATVAAGTLDPISADSGYPTRGLPPALAFAFDWCHDRFDAAATQATCATLAAWFDWTKANAFDATAEASAASNYFGGHVFGFLLAGLATQGECARGTEMVTWATTLLNTVVAPAFATGGMFEGGSPIEGYVYGTNGFVRYLLTALAVQSATGSTPTWITATAIARNLLHALRPNGWQFPDEADQPGDLTGVMDPTLAYLATKVLAGQPEAAALAFQTSHMTTGPVSSPNTLSAFLWRDPAAPEVDYRTTEPLYFFSPGDNHVYARTSWDDAGTVWTSYHAGTEMFTGHQQKSAGHLAIQRGADYLLVNAGQWKGPEGWAGEPSSFDMQACRTNTIQYPTLWTGTYCGGQGWWGTTQRLTRTTTAPYCTSSDLTSAYRTDNFQTTDLQLYVRTVCTLANGTSIVWSHVVGPQGKTEYWHTHQLANSRTGWQRLDASHAIARVGASQLLVTTLGHTLTTAADPAANMALYTDTAATAATTITWRLQIAAPEADAIFLDVFQPGALGSAAEPVTAIAGGAQVGEVKITFDASGVPTIQ